MWPLLRGVGLRAEQRLDGAASVHGAVALGDLGAQWQGEVEGLPGSTRPGKTRAIRSGNNRRTGAGSPRIAAWEKKSLWPSSAASCGTPT